ncbi:hypothetical protein [Cyprinid herpesvirus 2]|uniref:Uncharacterized protein n=1 Tax=Cyprinid herpesvirus 2 TaxID=317878 RepID=A0A0E3T5H6_CYHV2|nr:hypothetical protein [Cyprinid herpesvirus 2]
MLSTVSPLCGLIKFLVRLTLDMLVAAIGVYISTSCIYDRSMFRTCPNSVCLGHLSVWVTVCVVPTMLGGMRWAQQFMFWVSLKTAARRRAGIRPGNGFCSSYREVLLENADDKMIQEEMAAANKTEAPPAPNTMTVNGPPVQNPGAHTTVVLFGFVCFVSYIVWTVVSPHCEWYIYVIPALVCWKVLRYSGG